MATTRTRLPNPLAEAPALLRDLARLHVRAQRAALAGDDTRNTACIILTELGRSPATTLAELARRLRLDKGWTSRAVDQLAAAGLVEKVPSPSDRRTFAVSLSRTGRIERKRLDLVLDAQVARVIDRVPADRRESVARALRLLHDAYVAELASATADPRP
jgi:DNA-binding MarR family transcriptional regulator